MIPWDDVMTARRVVNDRIVELVATDDFDPLGGDLVLIASANGSAAQLTAQDVVVPDDCELHNRIADELERRRWRMSTPEQHRALDLLVDIERHLGDGGVLFTTDD